jgi:hypothetical protein
VNPHKCSRTYFAKLSSKRKQFRKRAAVLLFSRDTNEYIFELSCLFFSHGFKNTIVLKKQTGVGKDVLSKVVYKIVSGVLWRLLGLFTHGNNERRFSESLPYRITAKHSK